jgi:hypothetical protein
MAVKMSSSLIRDLPVFWRLLAKMFSSNSESESVLICRWASLSKYSRSSSALTRLPFYFDVNKKLWKRRRTSGCSVSEFVWGKKKDVWYLFHGCNRVIVLAQNNSNQERSDNWRRSHEIAHPIKLSISFLIRVTIWKNKDLHGQRWCRRGCWHRKAVPRMRTRFRQWDNGLFSHNHARRWRKSRSTSTKGELA